MPARSRSSAAVKTKDSTATIGFEAKFWLLADKLRSNMDAAEYKHVVLGLIFLKYISDTFEEYRARLVARKGGCEGVDPKAPDEYKVENVFWGPKEGRRSWVQASAKLSGIGKTMDDAMVAIERDNPRLKGVLPKDYARPGLDKTRLGELIDLIAGINLTGGENPPLGGSAGAGLRILPHPLRQRRGQERRAVPHPVMRGALAGGDARFYKGRIYDPACGVEVHQKKSHGRNLRTRPRARHRYRLSRLVELSSTG